MNTDTDDTGFTHYRVDLLTTDRYPGGDRLLGAWVSLCDVFDRSLLTVELHNAGDVPVYGRDLYAALGRLAAAAVLSWPAWADWDHPVDDGAARFVEHRATPEGRAYEVVAESVRFPLVSEPTTAAAAPERPPLGAAA